MSFDPTLPSDGSPLASAEMRAQLTGLKALIDAIATLSAAQVDGVFFTGDPGTAAAAEVLVTGNTLRFTFTIPRGDPGAPGDPGMPGDPGIPGDPGPPGEVTLSQLQDAIQTTSANSNSVATLGASAAFDYDPTQMQDVIYKLDELINALRRV